MVLHAGQTRTSAPVCSARIFLTLGGPGLGEGVEVHVGGDVVEAEEDAGHVIDTRPQPSRRSGVSDVLHQVVERPYRRPDEVLHNHDLFFLYSLCSMFEPVSEFGVETSELASIFGSH